MTHTPTRVLCSAAVLLAALMTIGIAPPAAAGVAGGSKYFGSIIGYNNQSGGDYSLFWPPDFLDYFNQVTAENANKWGYLQKNEDDDGEPDSGNWDMNEVNRAIDIYNFALDNDIPYKVHTLVWGRSDQDEDTWRQQVWQADPTGQRIRTQVENWINWNGRTFPQATYVDVVNEYLNEPLSYANAFVGQVTTSNFPGLSSNYQGDTNAEWVLWCFLKARQAFPNSQLLINDFTIINHQNDAAYKQLVNMLKSYTLNGQPIIDGIGIQAHTFNLIEYGGEDSSNIQAALDNLGQTGLPIHISEMDIERDQLVEYQRVFPLIWNHPKVVGVTLWGYSIGRTWRSGTGLVDHSGATPVPNAAMNWLEGYILYNQNPPNDFYTEVATGITDGGGRTDEDGHPIVNWQNEITLTAAACPAGQTGSATYTIVFDEAYPTLGGSMTQQADGSFRVVVQPVYDSHGQTTVTIDRTCNGVTQSEDTPMYVDPSGFVRMTDGTPVIGATVQLWRSDAESGPFTMPASGSDIMSEYNRTNPDTTDGNGAFGWDVQPGYYKVRASHPNCVSPVNPSQPYVETPAMGVPPEVTDLDIRLHCTTRDANVSVSKTSDWGSGYCANVVVTNNTSSAMDWIAKFDTEGTIYDFWWNVNYSQNGPSVTVEGYGDNNLLAPGASTHDVGFCANRTGSGSSYPIRVRARGTTGQEVINLTVGGTVVATWTLSTTFQDYAVTTSLAGGINVVFVNDAGTRDVVVDYVAINNVVHQAEAQTVNTAAWGNGTCGGGQLTEWMHCNGYIGFPAFK